jgi:phenylalanyl-tRNA synthetase beta chain
MKKRKLSKEDLMICDAEENLHCRCIWRVHSGVTDKTKNIFLESAWFNPVDIRIRVFAMVWNDAATRFEKH